MNPFLTTAGLRVCLLGGAHLPRSLVRQAEEWNDRQDYLTHTLPPG